MPKPVRRVRAVTATSATAAVTPPLDPASPTALYAQARRRLLANRPLLALAEVSDAGYDALSATEAAALESVGLSGAPWTCADGPDPWVRSVADFMGLLDTSLTAAAAAADLKVDVSRIRQRLRERSLFGIDHEGEHRLPRFQFERGRVLPGLREILAALPAALNPLDVVEWFLAPHPDLEIRGDHVASPREWLLRGNSVQEVVALARAFD